MIKVYKTFEIGDNLWQMIADGFNESFEGHHVTVESLKNGFSIRNQWGYAYHAVAFDDATGEIKGFNTYTPSLYKNQLKLFIGGSAFVRKKYRKDIFIFFDMIEALKEKGIEEGFVAALGVPNHNALDYSLKFFGATLIGFLDYYILPRNISRCVRKPWLFPINWLTRCLTTFYVDFQYLLSNLWNNQEIEPKYSLVVDDEYLNARFADSCYIKYIENKFTAYFRIVYENGVKVAYLMDFREDRARTKRALVKAVRFIIKTKEPDAILFVGFLRMKQHVLLKVPKRYIPKPLPFVYGTFTKADRERYKDMKDMNNWNYSLMNFDVK